MKEKKVHKLLFLVVVAVMLYINSEAGYWAISIIPFGLLMHSWGVLCGVHSTFKHLKSRTWREV